MNPDRALLQLRTVSELLSRTQPTTCFRAEPVLMTGVLAMLALPLSWYLGIKSEPQMMFATFWLLIAIVAAAIVIADVAYQYLKTESELQRGRTRSSVKQIAPALLLGGLTTLCIMRQGEAMMALLPGLWCLFVSLSVFSLLPNAPSGMIGPAMLYAVCGGCYLSEPDMAAYFGHWTMALPFAVGQTWTAALLAKGTR